MVLAEFFPLMTPIQVGFDGKTGANSENELVCQLENKWDFIFVYFRMRLAHLCTSAARFLGRWWTWAWKLPLGESLGLRESSHGCRAGGPGPRDCRDKVQPPVPLVQVLQPSSLRNTVASRSRMDLGNPRAAPRSRRMHSTNGNGVVVSLRWTAGSWGQASWERSDRYRLCARAKELS